MRGLQGGGKARFGSVGGAGAPGAALYLMPPPNGVNDLPAFLAILAQAAVTGGVIRFRHSTVSLPYKSPTGFVLDTCEGITLQGAGASLSGTVGTVLCHTGARAKDEATVKLLSCNHCTVQGFGFLSTVSGAEYACLIGRTVGGDCVECFVFDCEIYGHAAAAPVATSATSINLSTVVNVATAVTLSAASVPYAVNSQLMLASRGGFGMMVGEITGIVGNVVTFIPRDVFGTATRTDWDVLQPYSGVYIGAAEFCGVDRCLATLCYNSFRVNGVGGYSGASNGTSAPLGPSFRSDTSSSYIQIFGNAEYNLNYQWTVALYVNGALNFEAAVGMGDQYTKGIPYVLRGIQCGRVHNLNAQSPGGGSVFVISVEGCTALAIDTVRAAVPAGGFVLNVSGNTQCRVTNLRDAVGGMVTFGSGNNLGFIEWWDVAAARLNFGYADFQFITTRYGSRVLSSNVVLSNGANNNITLGNGFGNITGPTAAFSISGFAPQLDGQQVYFEYAGAQQMTLVHNAVSAVGARLFCPTGADIVLAAPPAGGFHYLKLMYSSRVGGWLVTLPR